MVNNKDLVNSSWDAAPLDTASGARGGVGGHIAISNLILCASSAVSKPQFTGVSSTTMQAPQQCVVPGQREAAGPVIRPGMSPGGAQQPASLKSDMARRGRSEAVLLLLKPQCERGLALCC